MSQLKIFLAEPDRDSRLGMQMLLEHKQGMRVVGIAVQSERIVMQVVASQPDVVLLDWGIVASSPVEIISNLHSLAPHLKIIVLDTRSETGQKAKSAGADAFFCKDSYPDQLLKILYKVKAERLTI
jgi:DNA-binding NarL/FixJ family response regulator